MVRRVVSVLAVASAFLLGLFLLLPSAERSENEEEGHALEAFEFWYGQRAAPYDLIPQGAFLRAAEYSRTRVPHESSLDGITDTSSWTSIGPDNVGGRVLAIAIDPVTPSVVWVGAASGGLWKSTTGGAGAAAWTYVNTGHPTLAVSSIAIVGSNPAIMYIGTGEVGSAYGRGQVGTPGARSSYGMGVLKSTDGGASWSLTGLIFSFPQVAAVQKVLLNPLNPNTVYAVTTEGTYKSTNAGATWTLVHGVLMGMDIVINPSDTTVLYACYGQRNSTTGTGIYKTTNAGTTWNRLTSLDTTNFGRTSLALSASNPQVVYAGVAHGGTSQLRGLYRTTNGGASWTLQSTTNYVSAQGWYDNVIAVHPANQNLIYCAGLDIYKSTDGGVTLNQKAFWYQGYDGVVPAGGPEGPPTYAHADHHAITFDPSNPTKVFFGSDGGIFVSTDGGETFAGRNGGFATTQFYAGFANAETSPTIALGGLQDNGTLKYTGALSWDKTYGGDGGWCAIDPTNADVMYEEYIYLTISKSTNGGASWFGATSGLATGSSNANFIAPFVIAPSSPNILYGGAKVVYKTVNGGTSWFATNGGVQFNGTNVATIGVSPSHPDTLMAGTGQSLGGTFAMFASTNGGTSWSNVTGPLPARYPTDITFNPDGGPVAYLTFSGYGTPHVFKTTNVGQTWTNISSNLPDIPTQSIAVDPLFPSTLFVGTDLGVYRSLDGGASWHVFDAGMPPAMVLDVVVAQTARTLRAATFGNGIYERDLPAPALFDYRALAFVSPAAGAEILVNTAVGPISATFRNVGAAIAPDSFDVRYRILNGPLEVYSSTKRIAPLGYGESRTITFDETFTPASAGLHTLQAMTLAADQNADNDTLSGTLNVLQAGTVTQLNVLNVAAPYEEITGGDAGPTGDDAQSSLTLPFPFVFDGYTYDLLQISTNGWAEFGTGAAGTERGLSTSGQIGLGNENGRLYTNARPNKALGPWFEDMNADGTGQISTATLGIAPRRIFVVQWKNMLAYYDAGSTTTRVNLQIRLHEGTNIVEYSYGPVLAGTFGGDGAMMGFKDHLGGNYHFYDIALGGTGTTAQTISTLNPLLDWPGPGRSIVIGPDVTALTLSGMQDWNLIALPLTRTARPVSAIFPTANPVTTFRFTGGAYAAAESLDNGSGYWTKFPSATTPVVWGNPLHSFAVPVAAGWNLVGSVDHAVPAPAGGIIESFFYEYGPAGYAPAWILQPGRGYWVKTSSAGILTLGPAPARTAEPGPLADASIVRITDARRRSQALYLAGPDAPITDGERYLLPPSPPSGALDIRFASERLLEAIPRSRQDGITLPLAVNGAAWPLAVHFTPAAQSGHRILLEQIHGSRIVTSGDLRYGDVVLSPVEGSVLVLKIIADAPLPKAFALQQNYPNPFNPTTRIEYALPADSRVTITVYDITGREIVTLIDAAQKAGYGYVEWNGRNDSGALVGSGVYFCRLTAGEHVAVRKMLLTK